MQQDFDKRPRYSAALALVPAIALLVLGETVLHGRLSPVFFVVYWTVCILLTVAAIFAALRQLRDIQQTTRNAQHELVQATLREINEQARAKAKARERHPGVANRAPENQGQ